MPIAWRGEFCQEVLASLDIASSHATMTLSVILELHFQAKPHSIGLGVGGSKGRLHGAPPRRGPPSSRVVPPGLAFW